jgi:hypothetical protein
MEGRRQPSIVWGRFAPATGPALPVEDKYDDAEVGASTPLRAWQEGRGVFSGRTVSNDV